MIELIFVAALTLGLSESIETRLPEDPGMIYTVAFEFEGVKIGLDWKDRGVVAHRTCRKSSPSQRIVCQTAALQWLQTECAYYGRKDRLNGKQRDMQSAVCQGAKALQSQISAHQVADR